VLGFSLLGFGVVGFGLVLVLLALVVVDFDLVLVLLALVWFWCCWLCVVHKSPRGRYAVAGAVAVVVVVDLYLPKPCFAHGQLCGIVKILVWFGVVGFGLVLVLLAVVWFWCGWL